MKIYRNKEGVCINIGDWDDNNGLNPLPADAVESDEEVVIGWDGGKYVADDPRRLKI
jgi:hypothetical protein